DAERAAARVAVHRDGRSGLDLHRLERQRAVQRHRDVRAVHRRRQRRSDAAGELFEVAQPAMRAGSSSSCCFFLVMMRAGMPTAVAPAGTSLSTTALAPIIAPSPMVTGPRILAPQPT